MSGEMVDEHGEDGWIHDEILGAVDEHGEDGWIHDEILGADESGPQDTCEGYGPAPDVVEAMKREGTWPVMSEPVSEDGPAMSEDGPSTEPDVSAPLTAGQVGEMIGRDPRSVRRWARSGELRGHQFGGRETEWRFDRADVERFAAERGFSPSATVSDAVVAGEPAETAGGVLVPVDAWERMLDQLGHLHEAGQQLADARERAARAETVEQFLRDRVKELEAERDAATARASTPTPAAVAPTPRRGLFRRR